MVAGILYSNRENFRAFKIRIAAKHSARELEIEELESGQTGKSILDKFHFGKIPGFEAKAGRLNESHAIAYYISNDALKGGNPENELPRAQVLEWMNFADIDLLPAIFNHVFPILGVMPEHANKEFQKRNENELKKHLAVMNQHLRQCTYFVGEALTLADVAICCNCLLLFEKGMLAEEREKFPHLMRWFMTLVNQKHVKEVVGKVDLCTKFERLPTTIVNKNPQGLDACVLANLRFLLP